MALEVLFYRSATRARVRGRAVRAFVLIWILFSCGPALAHRSYESYLTLSLSPEPTLVWEIESNNFEQLFNLDDNGNEIVSWGELLNHQQLLLSYALNEIALEFDGQALPLQKAAEITVRRRGDQSYLVVPLQLPHRFQPEYLDLSYSLFFREDNQQRLIFTLDTGVDKNIYWLSPQENSVQVEVKENRLWFQIRQFTFEGVVHLFGGFDHLAFLLMLLLAQIRLTAQGHRQLLVQLFRVVSAFSVAHTLTLFLAAAGLVAIPTALIEVTIALTVMASAFSNALGRSHWLGWRVALLFGLVHGFGFANVLAEIDMPLSRFFILLLSFNLGLEIGQLLLIFVVLPLLLWLKISGRGFGRLTRACSIMTIGLSFFWVLERI